MRGGADMETVWASARVSVPVVKDRQITSVIDRAGSYTRGSGSLQVFLCDYVILNGRLCSNLHRFHNARAILESIVQMGTMQLRPFYSDTTRLIASTEEVARSAIQCYQSTVEARLASVRW